MADTDAGLHSHRSEWRELSRSLIQREVLYTISGFPDGVREAKIKTLMHDVFKYSFQGTVAPHLKELEENGFLSKESTKSGAIIWHADHAKVLNLVEQERAAMKHREAELRELHAYLVEMYGD